MAHGEAEHGCAQGETCRPGQHEQSTGAKHHRRTAGGPPYPGEPIPERADEEPTVPRQRVAEPPTVADPASTAEQGCLSDLPGWAGAHRHGPVRPRRRGGRRERPPQRWC
ncbi:hypothetical protein ACN28G_17830 [Micromonospora sp. WMMA1923]|uniref:hypothetical protein n=1 Tax=Micromonospora sp. WMMA1923 TaxID=3404125 RepID=UPI003B956F1E